MLYAPNIGESSLQLSKFTSVYIAVPGFRIESGPRTAEHPRLPFRRHPLQFPGTQFNEKSFSLLNLYSFSLKLTKIISPLNFTHKYSFYFLGLSLLDQHPRLLQAASCLAAFVSEEHQVQRRRPEHSARPRHPAASQAQPPTRARGQHQVLLPCEPVFEQAFWSALGAFLGHSWVLGTALKQIIFYESLPEAF